ncbi:hypothetical protein [Nocardioides sp. SYSU DS0651]|uniref:hypothetical protein n=1 Tax=Nocardioides sp. SYSU DS0651 TaxID=3415955 RepID=UPI003F4B599C
MSFLLGTDRLVLLAAAALASPLVAGCGGGDDEGGRAEVDQVDQVDQVEEQAVDAVDGVVHDVADATGIAFVSGNRFFSICGESYAPRGVVLRSFLQFEPSELPDAEAADRAAESLAAGGWDVEQRSGSAVVEAAKDDLRMKVEFGPAAAVVGLNTDCVETSDDVAREYDDRDDVEVEWG